jgi:hypothetical protein
MPAQRVTFLFSDQAGYGWTVSLWYLPGGLTGLNSDVTALIQAFNNIMASDIALEYVRISSGLVRAPYFVNVNPTGAPTGTGTGTSAADFVALKLRLTGVAGGIGRIFVRGISSDQYDGDNFVPTPDFFLAYGAFQATLIQGGKWGIQTNAFSGTATRYPVTNMGGLLPRGYSFQIPTNPIPLVVGSLIRMHNAVIIGYNGLKKVTAITGTGPYVVSVGGASPQAAEPGTNSPYFTLITYTYPAIGFTTEEGVTRRNSGRFFGQRRGRRSTVLPLRQ